MSEGQYGNSNIPDLMVITDLGGDEHAIDRRNIITMTSAIPKDTEGFVMGGTEIITIVINSPAGLISYHTRETLISLIKRVNKASSIKEHTYQRGKDE